MIGTKSHLRVSLFYYVTPRWIDEGESEGEEEDESSESEASQDGRDSVDEEAKTIAKTTTESDGAPESSLVPCPNCNRTFFPERLNIHLKSCKPGKPMKGKPARKPMYQPPKLKTRTKWMAPPEDHDPEGDENVAHNPLPNNKSKPKSIAKKSPRKSEFKTLDLNNSDFNDDPNVEFKTGMISNHNEDFKKDRQVHN